MVSTAYEREAPSEHLVEDSLRDAAFGVFWFDDAPGRRWDRLTSDLDTDLLVVGGGYTGLWTALLAKERDPSRRVALVEADTLGWAASGRNGGFCESSLTHGYDNGNSRWPSEMPLLERLGHQNLAEIVDTIERHAMDVDLERSGVLQLAVEDHQVPWLREKPRDDRRVFLEQDEIRARIRSPIVKAGYWDKDENVLIHPTKLVHELARVAQDAGVEIYERTPVRGLRGSADQVAALTDHGKITARHVALGTNVFAPLLKRNRLMTVPVYDYALATEPLTSEQIQAVGWQGREGLTDLANQFHYTRLTADNRIIFGGYDALYFPGRSLRSSYEDRITSHRRLARHFFTMFPQLEGVRFSHRWGGVVDTSTRFCAFFGTAYRGRVAYATGYTGLGVAATRFGGNVMLDLLAGEETDRVSNSMVRQRPLPFPPEPIATLGIQATRWSLDRADHNYGKRNIILRTLDRFGLGFDS